MTKYELKDTLHDAINRHGVKEIIEQLIELTDKAAENNPRFGWENDRQALRAIVEMIKN